MYFLEAVPLTVQGRVLCNQLLICSLVSNAEKLCLQSREHSGKTKETHYPAITLQGNAPGMGNTYSSHRCSSWLQCDGSTATWGWHGQSGPWQQLSLPQLADVLLLGLGKALCCDPCSVYQTLNHHPGTTVDFIYLHVSTACKDL